MYLLLKSIYFGVLYKKKEHGVNVLVCLEKYIFVYFSSFFHQYFSLYLVNGIRKSEFTAILQLGEHLVKLIFLNGRLSSSCLAVKTNICVTAIRFPQVQDTHTNLHVVPVKSSFPHDQQVSLRVRRAEPLLAEGQEASGTGQEEQRWDAVGHPVWLFAEEYCPRWEVWRPHALWCVSVSSPPVL